MEQVEKVWRIEPFYLQHPVVLSSNLTTRVEIFQARLVENFVNQSANKIEVSSLNVARANDVSTKLYRGRKM